jgi:hypothetical protein
MLEDRSDTFSHISVIYRGHPLNETDYIAYLGATDTRSRGPNVYAIEPACHSFYNRWPATICRTNGFFNSQVTVISAMSLQIFCWYLKTIAPTISQESDLVLFVTIIRTSYSQQRYYHLIQWANFIGVSSFQCFEKLDYKQRGKLFSAYLTTVACWIYGHSEFRNLVQT